MKKFCRYIVTAILVISFMGHSLYAQRVFELLNMYDGLPESRVRCLSTLSDGRLVLGTAGTITLFDGSRFHAVPVTPDRLYPLSGYMAYRRLSCDVEDRIWLRNTGTLCVMAPTGDGSRSSEFALMSVDSVLTSLGWQGDSIVSFFLTNVRDSVTSYWLTDAKGDFYRLEGGSCRLVANLKAVGVDFPEEVYAIEDRLFIGYHTGRICEFRLQEDDGRSDAYPIGTLVFSGTDNEVFPSDEIRQGINMIRCGDQLWLTLNLKDEQHSYVKRLDLQTHEWLPHLFFPMRVSSLAMSPDSTAYFVGTDGIYIISPSGTHYSHLVKIPVKQTATTHTEFLTDNLSSILFDRFGNLWVGTTESGLLHWHPSRRELICMDEAPYALPLAPQYVSERAHEMALRYAPEATNCSAETSDGTVYLGTRNGLLVIAPDGHLITCLDENDGLASPNIHAILLLSPSSIWVATATGITHVNPISKGVFYLTHFGGLDGLFLSGCELHPCEMAFEETTGLIRIGFQGGSVVFRPEELLASPRYVFCHTISDEPLSSHNKNAYWWLLLFPLLALTLIVWRRRKWGAVETEKMSEGAGENAVGVEGRLAEEENRLQLPKAMSSEAKIQKILQSCQTASDTSTEDERFLSRLQKIVEEHLDDEDFSVQNLASEMAMDRTVLFRRMQALTGISPSTYIRSVRMNAAARLLRDSSLSIADIAQQTGFGTPKYFSRIFKETFGVLPREYKNASHNQA